MVFRLGCVVEGDGETEAVPVLVRRLATDLHPGLQVVTTNLVLRVPRYRLVRPGELERHVVFLAARLADAILVIIDSDDDCPAELGPLLHSRAINAHSALPVAVVLAKFEYESWFLGAAGSLAGRRGLGTSLQPHPDPESVRGAKGWLSRNMEGSRIYKETSDQAALTAVFDMDAALSACDSFRKCHKEIGSLLSGCVAG